MNINAEIAVQSGSIHLTDFAGVGIHILFGGPANPTPRKYQQYENADPNDYASHGSPPSWNESLTTMCIRGVPCCLADRSSFCFDLSFRCESPKESQRVAQPSSHLFARTGGNYYCKDTHELLRNTLIGRVGIGIACLSHFSEGHQDSLCLLVTTAGGARMGRRLPAARSLREWRARTSSAPVTRPSR